MAESFKEFISNKNYLTKENCQEFVESLSKEESYKKMMSFYEGQLTKEKYIDIIYKGFNLENFETESPHLKLMHENFRLLIRNEGLLEKKVNLIKEYDFKKLGTLLEPTLPENTQMDINIYFVIDGINAGSALDMNTMLLYTMIFPSDKKDLELIEGILLHEYHHLGLKYWLEKDPLRGKILSEKNHLKVAWKLSEALMGEGAATYFFNRDHNIYPLLLESYGKSFAQIYQNAMDSRTNNVNKLMEELEKDLNTIIDNKKSYSEMIDILNGYTFNAEGGEPKDKTVGCYMCGVIEEELGRKYLIQSFLAPKEFILKYHEASQKSGAYTFSEDIVSKWERLFDRLD